MSSPTLTSICKASSALSLGGTRPQATETHTYLLFPNHVYNYPVPRLLGLDIVFLRAGGRFGTLVVGGLVAVGLLPPAIIICSDGAGNQK